MSGGWPCGDCGKYEPSTQIEVAPVSHQPGAVSDEALRIAREALEHYAHGPDVDTDAGLVARDALARMDAADTPPTRGAVAITDELIEAGAGEMTTWSGPVPGDVPGFKPYAERLLRAALNARGAASPADMLAEAARLITAAGTHPEAEGVGLSFSYEGLADQVREQEQSHRRAMTWRAERQGDESDA